MLLKIQEMANRYIPAKMGGEGKGTGLRALSTHCVGHSQLTSYYKYQS